MNIGCKYNGIPTRVHNIVFFILLRFGLMSLCFPSSSSKRYLQRIKPHFLVRLGSTRQPQELRRGNQESSSITCAFVFV